MRKVYSGWVEKDSYGFLGLVPTAEKGRGDYLVVGGIEE